MRHDKQLIAKHIYIQPVTLIRKTIMPVTSPTHRCTLPNHFLVLLRAIEIYKATGSYPPDALVV